MQRQGRKCNIKVEKVIKVENVIEVENVIKVENATPEVENATSW